MSDTTICRIDQLTPDLGVAGLLENNEQIALFKLSTVYSTADSADADSDESLYAVSNIDPYTNTGVISRGIVGEVDGRPTIASPLLKQRFFLDTGESLQEDDKTLKTYKVRVEDDSVIVTA